MGVGWLVIICVIHQFHFFHPSAYCRYREGMIIHPEKYGKKWKNTCQPKVVININNKGITIYEVPQPFDTFVFVDLLQHMKYVFLLDLAAVIKSAKHLKWFLIQRLCGS